MVVTGAEASSRAAEEAPTKVSHLAPLDGIRALAILLVLFFHGGFGWASGGFFGVDVFFVLSGFLITGLLLAEFTRTSTIRLGRFWIRRVRRLMPALLVLLVIVAGYAAFFAQPSAQHQLRVDGLTSLFYVSNWNLAHGTQGYFAALASSTPRPLLHTWSLAIEEQFYLIWPPILFLVLKVTRSLRVLFSVALGGAIASAVLMMLVVHGTSGQTRAYYGTDTRAQAVAIGAALAVLLANPLRRSHDAISAAPLSLVRPVELKSWTKRLLSLAGAASLASLLVLTVVVSDSTSWFYRGGFFVASLITAILIASVVLVPATRWSKLLSIRPLRYIGAISYGLYLWHWPIFLFLNNQRTGLSGTMLFALRMGVTFAIAAASSRFLEMPIRRGALKGLAGLFSLLGSIALVAVLLVVSTTGGATTGRANKVNKALNDLIARAGSTSQQAINDPGTAPNAPTVATGTGGPLRVLLLGDSEAAFLALGMQPQADAAGYQLANDAVIGCGLVQSHFSKQQGQLRTGLAGYRGSHWVVPCASQLTRWTADVRTFNPDVVVVVEGALEVMDHFMKDHWTSILKNDLATAEKKAVQQAVGALKGTGATIVLTTAPYYSVPEAPNGQPWPESDPARVKRYNEIIREVAAANSPQVKVLDVHGFVNPTGTVTQQINGTNIWMADGIHLNPDGAWIVSSWLLPRVAALAAAHRS